MSEKKNESTSNSLTRNNKKSKIIGIKLEMKKLENKIQETENKMSNLCEKLRNSDPELEDCKNRIQTLEDCITDKNDIIDVNEQKTDDFIENIEKSCDKEEARLKIAKEKDKKLKIEATRRQWRVRIKKLKKKLQNSQLELKMKSVTYENLQKKRMKRIKIKKTQLLWK